jgi:hypothetical protein
MSAKTPEEAMKCWECSETAITHGKTRERPPRGSFVAICSYYKEPLILGSREEVLVELIEKEGVFVRRSSHGVRS